MSKILKTKRSYVYIVYRFLKSIPPKEFDTIDEMEKVMDEILPVMEADTKEYVEIGKKADAARKEFADKKITEEQTIEKLKAIEKESVMYGESKGQDVVELALENDPFNTFFQLFEKWGKGWFGTIEGFLEFRKAMNETNQQSKK